MANDERSIADWCRSIHSWAHDKGFYPEKHAPWKCEHVSGSVAAQLMLITTEVAEACEADRIGDVANFREELADIAIRLFDLCEAQGVRLEDEIRHKMITNEGREHSHGKRY